MSMIYRIAGVSFLNTVPLIDHLLRDKEAPVILSRDMPSRLGQLLDTGAADAALVPVVEILRRPGVGVIPGFGIACFGEVGSVKMFHRGDVQDLKRIWTDRGSRTSVALLQILLREVYEARPDCEEFEPSPGFRLGEHEGQLVIGDRCFELEKSQSAAGVAAVGSVDLGAAWRQFTGLPFVFALWAVSARFLARASAEEISTLIGLINGSGEAGLARLDELAEREAARGALGHKGEATAAAVAYYFRESLRLRVGDEELAGLARFRELCIKHGLVPDGPAPLILRG